MIGSLDESLHRGLQPVAGAVPVFVSPGQGPGATRIVERVERAHAYYVGQLGVEPRIAVLILGPDEWGERSNHPLYGMPNYRDGNLVLAGQANPFWEGLVSLAIGEVPGAGPMLAGAYPSERGTVDLSPFFDLLAVHELAHIFIEADGRVPARLWLLELACNVLLHSFVAAVEPRHLPTLETFPAVFARIAPERFTHRTVSDFEASYAHGMDGANYGWFQARFHVAAKHVHGALGAAAPRALWDLLGEAGSGDVEQLVVERLGPSAAEVVHELELSSRPVADTIRR